MLNKSEHLLLGLLVVVAPPGAPHSNSVGNVAHTLGPHELVQVGVHPHILGSHSLLHKLFDLADRTGGLLFESAAEKKKE